MGWFWGNDDAAAMKELEAKIKKQVEKELKDLESKQREERKEELENKIEDFEDEATKKVEDSFKELEIGVDIEIFQKLLKNLKRIKK